jgi:raffinose/stachyose/melibiose transport system permease protein
MRSDIRSKYGFIILTIPAVVLFGMFVVAPILMGGYYSFTDWNGISRTFHFNWGANYVQLVHDSRTLNALGITLWYTFISVTVIVVLAFTLALLLSRSNRFCRLFRSIYFFPAVLSLVLVGMIFFNIYSGPLPELGKALGLDFLSKNLIAHSETALLSILIPNIWQGVAIPLVIFVAGLSCIPDQILEAASIDGAGSFKRMLYITLPYMVSSIQVVIILLLRNGITTFDYVQAITNGGPGYVTETVPLLIYANAFAKMKYSFAITQSMMLLVLMAGISMIQMKLLSKKDVSLA